MSRKHQIKSDNLTRFLVYILGHRPDEFGLVPDQEGFIAFKELLQAIHEEPGWGYVRRGHIHEILQGKERDLFETEDDRIRVLERRWHLDLDCPSRELQKILYIGVRKRAHSHALQKGLKSPRDRFLVLSPERSMAMRIGKRQDRIPVLLEIRTEPAQQAGTPFFPFGLLFLCTEISVQWISGPPLPKDFIKKEIREPEKPEKIRPGFAAGSFVLEPERDPAPHRKAQGRKQKGWKEDVRKARRRRKS